MDFTQLISDFAERHGIANLAAEDNAAALVNQAETWRRLLADFRPAAEETAAETDVTGVPSFSAYGFMQV